VKQFGGNGNLGELDDHWVLPPAQKLHPQFHNKKEQDSHLPFGQLWWPGVGPK
jgi:hypothetical protein